MWLAQRRTRRVVVCLPPRCFVEFFRGHLVGVSCVVDMLLAAKAAAAAATAAAVVAR